MKISRSFNCGCCGVGIGATLGSPGVRRCSSVVCGLGRNRRDSGGAYLNITSGCMIFGCDVGIGARRRIGATLDSRVVYGLGRNRRDSGGAYLEITSGCICGEGLSCKRARKIDISGGYSGLGQGNCSGRVCGIYEAPGVKTKRWGRRCSLPKGWARGKVEGAKRVLSQEDEDGQGGNEGQMIVPSEGGGLVMPGTGGGVTARVNSLVPDHGHQKRSWWSKAR